MEAAAPAPDSGLELGGNTSASISTRWGVLASTGATTPLRGGEHCDTVGLGQHYLTCTSYILSGKYQVLHFSIVCLNIKIQGL